MVSPLDSLGLGFKARSKRDGPVGTWGLKVWGPFKAGYRGLHKGSIGFQTMWGSRFRVSQNFRVLVWGILQ